MARTIPEIKAQIVAAKNAEPSLSGLTSTSQASIWNGWSYITAYALWYHESQWDIKKAEIEELVSNRAVGTEAWIQRKVLDFQYDAVTPQVISLNSDFVPSYSLVDATKRIVTRCSVKTFPSKAVHVKVAKNDPPEALTVGELNSLAGYLDDLCFAGTQINATSIAPDRIYASINIYYDGQYASTISASTIAALEEYLSAIPFDGQVRIGHLVDSIQNVEGVSEVVIKDLAIRPAANPFASKTYLVQNNQTIIHKYQLFAGYVIGEDTASYTLTDTLTFIAES